MADTIEFVLMRGGTSKGVFLLQADVPNDRAELSAILLDIFGSPDHRQIDGLGGADKLTSKAAIIGPPTVPGADVDYLFAQVGISVAQVDYLLNCGNLSAAVGVYAIEEGLVKAGTGTQVVRINNINTGRLVIAHVPCEYGRPVSSGDYTIAGVPGAGAPIGLDFARAAGAITGKLFPLGDIRSAIEVPGLGSVDVSVVDCANLVVFIEASAVGLTAEEEPSVLDGNVKGVALINAIRRAIAHRIGLGEYFDAASAPATPIAVVLAPHTDPARADLSARIYANGATSRAYAGTVAACTGVAARLEGSVPYAALSQTIRERPTLRIAHPAGVIDVAACLCPKTNEIHHAMIHRTARRIAEGRVYPKDRT